VFGAATRRHPARRPNGNLVAGLFHNMPLEIIGGPQRVGEQLWWQVRTEAGQGGWMLGTTWRPSRPRRRQPLNTPARVLHMSGWTL